MAQIPDSWVAGAGQRVGLALATMGSPRAASYVMRVMGGRIRESHLRADFLGNVARAELARGLQPGGLTAAYSALLDRADEHHAAGDVRRASAAVAEAMMLAFHRVLHVDRLSSPMDADPRRYLEPFRRSVAANAVAAPRGRGSAASAPPTGRPLRLLVVTQVNANFVGLIRSYYDQHPEVEIRFLDLAADPATSRLAKGLQRMVELRMGGQAQYAQEVEEALRPHLDWADTVWVEWCTTSAVFLTLVDPGTTRVVIRLHRFEAYTYWPHLVDFSRVNELVFIAEHVRDLVTEALPRLSEPDAPRLRRVDNALDLTDFRRPKEAGARFTLGLVGMGQIAKDPLWAIEVLRLLRSHDSRYRLLLVGAGLNPAVSAAGRAYHDVLESDLAELEPSGAVTRWGPSDDVPGVLTQIGVILSSSVREGSHCALVEGAASGAVPVVRDWPSFAGKRNGARTLFPEEWVVGSPQEAVTRILAETAGEERWHESGRIAAEHAMASWDWSVVRQDFDGLLLGKVDK